MPKPIPGKMYIAVDGDTLSIIAGKAYGDPTRWDLISSANVQGLKTDDPEAVTPGRELFIPDIPGAALAPADIPQKGIDDLTVLIDGFEMPIESARVISTMDTAADGWSIRFGWTPGENPDLDARVAPFKYDKTLIYIGNDLVLSGLVYVVSPKLSSDEQSKTLEGASYTAEAVDSHVQPPYERNNITLEQLARELLRPVGIDAVFDSDSGAPFDRVTASPTDTIFAFLAGLAAQRGFLVTSTPSGDMLFLRANVSGAPVGTIREGDLNLAEEFGATFDGRKRFNTYRAIGQGPGDTQKIGLAMDNNVPRSRFHTFEAQDTTAGNIETAAEWKRSQMAARSVAMPLPVDGWIAPNGFRWMVNTRIAVESPTLSLTDGGIFTINRVEFVYDGDKGRTAALSVVPSGAYTLNSGADPWS